MPDPSDIPKSLTWELDDLLAQATAEQQKNQLVYDEPERALGPIARRFYPHIANWKPDDLRRLADRIFRSADPFCRELADMQLRGEKDPGRTWNVCPPARTKGK